MKLWRHAFVIAAVISSLCIFSCASTPKPNGGNSGEQESSTGRKWGSSDSDDSSHSGTAQDGQSVAGSIGGSSGSSGSGTSLGVSISFPKTKGSYFYSIDQKALDYAENGSPSSFKLAISELHKPASEEYTQVEQVLLEICVRVMKTVWPSEIMNYDYSRVSFSNPYTPAIDAAEKGIFDSSTGNSDFYTLLLPTLLLVTRPTKTDYYPEYEKALLKALDLKPKSCLANYLMGLLQNNRGEYKSAITYLNKALSSAPKNREILYALAYAYHGTGEYQKALDMGEELLVFEAQNISYLELCTQASISLGLYDKAESFVLRVLQVEPNNSNFTLVRASILIAKGDYLKASSLLDSYSRTSPNDRYYLLLRAELQRTWNKNLSQASSTMAKALSLYPTDRETLLLSSKIASESNSSIGGNTALNLVTKVLELDEGNIEAKEVYVRELNKARRYNEAYTMSSELIKQEDVPLSVLYNHVDVCLSLGKNNEAWNIAEGLYKNDSTLEENIQVYIKVLVGTGRSSQALSLINSLLPTANTQMKSFLYYQKSLTEGTSDAALEDLRSRLTANPRNQDTLYRLYRIYYGRKDWRRAQYYLKQVIALNPNDSTYQAQNAELENLLR
ncbi:MAG: tetratricopeptide repeat protein [Treponema sp.]|nr:tetratricopeptide repeat protein [Treponema sp.]